MNKPIGGRGKKAPYETTHVRIPVDLKSQVEKLVEDYRNSGLVILDNNDNKSPLNQSINYREFVDCMIQEFKQNGLYLEQNEKIVGQSTSLLNEDDAYKSANNFMKSKRTKRVLVADLLSCIYGTAIDDPRLD
jgi:regulatory protein YycI of two-component signal transduction system YycFG